MRNWLGYEKALVLVVLAVALIAIAVLLRLGQLAGSLRVPAYFDLPSRSPWSA